MLTLKAVSASDGNSLILLVNLGSGLLLQVSLPASNNGLGTLQ